MFFYKNFSLLFKLKIGCERNPFFAYFIKLVTEHILHYLIISYISLKIIPLKILWKQLKLYSNATCFNLYIILKTRKKVFCKYYFNVNYLKIQILNKYKLNTSFDKIHFKFIRTTLFAKMIWHVRIALSKHSNFEQCTTHNPPTAQFQSQRLGRLLWRMLDKWCLLLNFGKFCTFSTKLFNIFRIRSCKSIKHLPTLLFTFPENIIFLQYQTKPNANSCSL